MESIDSLMTRWNNGFAAYGERSKAIEAEIKAVRQTMQAEKAPREGGFFAKLKAGIGDGMETLKANRRIRGLEADVAVLDKGIAAESLKCFGQMRAIALSRDAGVTSRLAKLQEPTQKLDEIQRLLRSAVQAARKAEDAQEYAYSVQDKATGYAAQVAGQAFINALERLSTPLRNAPEQVAQIEFRKLHDEKLRRIRHLVKESFIFNQSGKGAWLNKKAADALREDIKELQALDGRIEQARRVITEQCQAIAADAVSSACARDQDFASLHRMIKGYLPPDGQDPA